MTSPGSLRAIHSLSCPSYALMDDGSARCRVPPKAWQVFFPTCRIGSVVRLKISLSAKKSLIALCTIWPDSNNTLLENYISVDASVQLSSSSGSSSKRCDQWVEGDCEILECVPPPKPCTSLTYRIKVHPESSSSSLPWNHTMGSAVSSASFYGLPIISKATIRLKHPQGCIISLNKTSSSEHMTIGGAGLMVNPEKEKSHANDRIKESIRNQNNCQTKAVQEIITRVIDPILQNVPNSLHFKGMMLLGPPGVGKSYALKVVKEICSDRCEIEIVQVSIPDLLAAENPLKMLDNFLKLDRGYLGSASNLSSQSSFASRSSYNIIPRSDFIEPSMSPGAIVTPFKFGTQSSTSSKSSVKKAAVNTSNDERTLPKITFMLLDEIDALGHQRNHNETQIAIKERISNWFDIVNSPQPMTNKSYYCMVATSNRAEDIDVMFRRGGRLEHEINVMNTQDDRNRLFSSYLHGLALLNDSSVVHFENKDSDIAEIAGYCAEKTGGYVAADIASLIREVALALTNESENVSAVVSKSSRAISKLEFIQLMEDSMKSVPPSCLRGITVQLPTITLDDVVGYHDAKRELTKALSFSSPQMKHKLEKFGMNQSLGGVLLYGPPGNSKTRLITAAAATNNLPLISLSSADIYSAYVGDAEAEIRKAFTIARQAAPCILFFDEMDSLVTNRAHNTTSSGAASVEARVLSTFLNEMDGVNANAGLAGIIVVGATNRIDCIDAALIRKGRFYQTILIPPPNAEDRVKLLEYFLTKARLPMTLIDELKWKLYEGMSGAQIENLCKEEAMKAKMATL